MVFHLIYVSEKSRHFEECHVDDIIDGSQKKNGHIDVTGILISNGKFFIQLLEGRKDQVMETFNRISGDSRHFHIRVLFTGESSKRVFPEWSMGLVREPTDATMNQILPHLHTEINQHQKVRMKIQAALKSFNGDMGRKAG